MAKFNEYTVKATPEDADTLMLYDLCIKNKQTFTIQRNLELDCWKADQCGHQQLADEQQDGTGGD